MKTIFSIFILFFAFNLNAQNLDIATESGIKYKVTKDTSEFGVITITKEPLQELGSQFRSYINENLAQIINIDLQIEQLKITKQKLIADNKKYKDILTREGL